MLYCGGSLLSFTRRVIVYVPSFAYPGLVGAGPSASGWFQSRPFVWLKSHRHSMMDLVGSWWKEPDPSTTNFTSGGFLSIGAMMATGGCVTTPRVRIRIASDEC